MKRSILFRALGLSVVFTLLILTDTARAVHDDDIEVTISSGQLFTSNTFYESEFLDTTVSFETDEPGFDSENGTFQPGDELGFNVLQSLWYWNGSALATPTTTTDLMILGSGPNMTTVTPSSGVLSGFVLGSAGVDGVIHEHVDFELNPYNTADVGAYGLVLELTSPNGYLSSDPFLIVFNNGLSEVPFENGVDAIRVAAGVPVPEPGSLVLALLGAVGLAGAGWSRRRKGDTAQS